MSTAFRLVEETMAWSAYFQVAGDGIAACRIRLPAEALQPSQSFWFSLSRCVDESAAEGFNGFWLLVEFGVVILRRSNVSGIQTGRQIRTSGHR